MSECRKKLQTFGQRTSWCRDPKHSWHCVHSLPKSISRSETVGVQNSITVMSFDIYCVWNWEAFRLWNLYYLLLFRSMNSASHTCNVSIVSDLRHRRWRCSKWLGLHITESYVFASAMFYKNYRVTTLHPRQVFLCKHHYTTIFEMVEIETDLVWLPWSNSLLAFFFLQDWLEDPQKWLQISSVQSEIFSDGGRGRNFKYQVKLWA
jgi:hypothetical protein